MAQTDTILALVNLNSGDGSGSKLVEDYAAPLLKSAGFEVDPRFTKSAAEAGDLAQKHLAASKLPILVAGGDGTLHDIVNHLALKSAKQEQSLPSAEFIIIPTGTANALYSAAYPDTEKPIPQFIPSLEFDQQTAYKLLSVYAFINKHKAGISPNTLSVTRTRIFDPKREEPVTTLLSIVVASTSLHAGILHTSEKYRESIPGIERFKKAAQDNILNWGQAKIELLPSSSNLSQAPLLYDPSNKKFTLSEKTNLEGPFFYFLSTVNVDRLEAKFVITPLAKTIPPSSPDSLDLLIVRPARRPDFKGDTTKERQAFVPLAMEFFGGAYDSGKHVEILLSKEGKPLYLAEYFRVGGWRWTPTGEDEFSRLVCADGTVVEIPVGGYAEAKIISGEEGGFKVWF